MKIDHYSFGSITVDGESYTNDIIIFPNRVFSPWWRKEGHMLHMEDLADVIKEKPDILIIGKGYSGVMTVPENLIEKLKAMNMEVRAENSSEAVTLFNAVEGKKKIAALHLTC